MNERIIRPTFFQLAKPYFLLTKPGIVMGNAITTFGGFALASRGQFDFRLFLATLIGLSLIVASGCVFNNYIDRNADQKMTRTQNRPLAKGAISSQKALILAAFLGLFGTLLLSFFASPIALALAVIGFTVYVFWYSFAKYRTVHGTLIGSIAGAVPPVVGYCAVSHRFDLGALLLFIVFALWQMPHFYAIAIYRLEEYAAALIPVLPIKKGIRATKIHMLFYTLAFIAACFMLTLFRYTGPSFAITAIGFGLVWLWLALKGFQTDNDKHWARKMFIFSLIVVTALCSAIPFSY